MHRITVTAVAVLALACTGGHTTERGDRNRVEPSTVRPSPVLAIVDETDRLGREGLWPGFDPQQVPLAIYDGERTLLFRHPAPPDRFERFVGREPVWMLPGRHPAVVANSSTDLGGVRTATLLLPSAVERSIRSWAGILIHEAFHVFQSKRYPGWAPNEAHVFTYPVADADLLALRRLESEALRRAVEARRTGQSGCWARAALDVREERFSALPASAAAYERRSELSEGLANYVEHRALDLGNGAVIPREGFPAAAVRERSYATGLALALLLDRFSPEWKSALERGGGGSLDERLADAITPGGPRDCGFTAAERDRTRAVAARDVEALRIRREERLRSFLDREGWRIVVRAGRAPLFPKGFDPVNVEVVGPDRVLHTRFLELGGDIGTVEIMDRTALTAAAGEHPLFNGVRSIVVAGLEDEPTVTKSGGRIQVAAEGVRVEVREADIDRAGRTLTIVLP